MGWRKPSGAACLYNRLARCPPFLEFAPSLASLRSPRWRWRATGLAGERLREQCLPMLPMARLVQRFEERFVRLGLSVWLQQARGQHRFRGRRGAIVARHLSRLRRGCCSARRFEAIRWNQWRCRLQLKSQARRCPMQRNGFFQPVRFFSIHSNSIPRILLTEKG